jgi:hypothetical protein
VNAAKKVLNDDSSGFDSKAWKERYESTSKSFQGRSDSSHCKRIILVEKEELAV